MPQKFIKDDQLAKLLKNGVSDAKAIAKDGNTEDFWPVVKFFNPCGAAMRLVRR